MLPYSLMQGCISERRAHFQRDISTRHSKRGQLTTVWQQTSIHLLRCSAVQAPTSKPFLQFYITVAVILMIRDLYLRCFSVAMPTSSYIAECRAFKCLVWFVFVLVFFFFFFFLSFFFFFRLRATTIAAIRGLMPSFEHTYLKLKNVLLRI